MPGKQDGRSIRKEKNQLLFLDGLKKMGTVRNGLRTASIDRSTYKYWMSHDPDFPDRVADARQEFAEALEEVVVGIVMDPEAVKKSPVLAITLLNANMPSKYRVDGNCSGGYSAGALAGYQEDGAECSEEGRGEEYTGGETDRGYSRRKI